MLVHVVADYGIADLAYAEVAQRLLMGLPDARLVYTAVPPFATLASGFVVAQLALNEGPAARAIFQNVAPRKDDARARQDNDGERLVCARLEGGGFVVGPNSGYSFSFLRAAGVPLFTMPVSSSGSQFRSRDIFAGAFAELLNGNEALLGEPVSEGAVPAVPEGRIAYVDGYGNLKTTVTGSRFEVGSRVRVRVGDASREAVVVDGSFSVPDGDLAFSPGSSGWRLPSGGVVRYYEPFLRGGSAHDLFGRPGSGSEVVVEGVLSESSA